MASEASTGQSAAVRPASEIAALLDGERPRIIEQLQELLRIPSISALSAHQGDVLRCAEWLADHMRTIGLEAVALYPTPGNPIVYGEWLGAPGRPTALIYGHYDVQPVDPLSEWEKPPFDPVVRDGQIYGRGSTDDKGQLFMHLKVIEAYLRDGGALPMNLKVFLEGEEEVGSEHLDAFIEQHADLLSADVAVISDTSMFAKGSPSITYGLRGITYLQVDVRGPAVDLHSGSFGGAVANPVQVLCEMIASLKDADDHIVVPGFYNDVQALSSAERDAWSRLPFSEAQFKETAALGEKTLRGEAGYSVLERLWARPTLEINGIWGGFTGEGAKTIIPGEAHAKISCRLVPNQDPDQIGRMVKAHLEQIAPPQVEVAVTVIHSGHASLTPIDHPAVQAGLRALEKGFPGQAATFIREGGSIPVVATFQSVLGIPTVLIGVGLHEERAHAPNERFDLENFAGGMRSVAYLWSDLAASAD
jgi:acetylornithine deacetylase/succinyl-diaminopimelate desuccinylase-like protein